MLAEVTVGQQAWKPAPLRLLPIAIHYHPLKYNIKNIKLFNIIPYYTYHSMIQTTTLGG